MGHVVPPSLEILLGRNSILNRIFICRGVEAREKLLQQIIPDGYGHRGDKDSKQGRDHDPPELVPPP